MGSRGPVPKSSEQRRVAGSKNRNHASGGEGPAPARPKMPSWLPKEAQKEWRRVVKELLPYNLLTKIDADVLAVYCMTFATWRSASETIAAEGCTYKAKKSGLFKQHPAVAIEAAAAARLLQLLKEIAATPAARLRMRMGPPAGANEDDWLEEMIRKTEREKANNGGNTL